MRLVQVTIPTGKRQAVTEALEDEGVDYVLSDETSGREFSAIAHFPLPANAVEPVLERLRSAGLEEDAYTIVVDANTVISRRFDELSEAYAEDADADRIARQELQSAANDLMSTRRNYLALTIVSAIVATAGLLLNSPATVVGSMVIAPLIGPALAASVGTVIDDHELRARGVVFQATGLLAAVTSAAVFAAFVQVTNLVPPGLDVVAIEQVRERLAPDFLSLAVALGAGVAGALSLSTGVSAALVGVMIAVALIPPAAVVGIGIAWGEPTLALGSAVLLLVNVLSINLAALTVLWYQGYRPEAWFRTRDVRTMTLTRIAVIAGVILVLSVFLGAVTLAGYQGAVAEQGIQDAADDTVAEHENVTLLNVQVEGDRHPLRGAPENAIVTVGKPADVSAPLIAFQMEERIQDRLGYGVDVEVRFVELQTGEQPPEAEQDDTGDDVDALSPQPSKGSSGSKPIRSTASSTSTSRPSPSVTLT